MIRFYEILWEYWDHKFLMNMAQGIEALLKFHQATLANNFGHFVRVLVAFDLLKDLLESIMNEREGDKFFI